MELIPTQIGPYRLEDEIGRGQTVVVFRAFDTLYERSVALKIFPPYHQANQPENVRSFISEGREAMRLRHPNIVETFDAGLADGFHYIAQELAAHSLESVLAKQSEEIPVEASNELLEQLGAGLDYAHHLGIAHGALRPPNILLTNDGRPLLTNFDVEERRRRSVQDDLTAVKLVDLAYLAPEQAQGSLQSDSRTDIYALGVLAYRLLVGELPYQGDNVLSLLHAINNGIPYTPSSRQKALPPAVDSIILQALERTPSHRWKTAAAFVDALEKGSSGELVSVPLHETAPDDAAAPTPVEPEEFSEAAQLALARPPLETIPTNTEKAPVAQHGLPVTSETADEIAAEMADALTETRLQPVVLLDAEPATQMTPLVEGRMVEGRMVEGRMVPAKQFPAEAKRDKKVAGLTALVVALTTVLLLLLAGIALRSRPEWRTILTNGGNSPGEGQLELVLPAQDVGNPNSGDLDAEALNAEALDTSEPRQDRVVGDPDAGEALIANPDVEQESNVKEQSSKPVENEIDSADEGASVAQIRGANSVTQDDSIELDSGRESMSVAGASNRGGSNTSANSTSGDGPPLAVAILVATDTPSPTPSPTVVPTSPPTETATPLPTDTATVAPTNSPSPIPTEVPPTLVPATAIPEVQSDVVFASTEGDAVTPIEDAIDINSIGESADGTESEPGTEPSEEATLEPTELFGRIAYALWNPRSLAMDTYIYVIGSGVSPTPLVNRRQPDFRRDGWLAFNAEGGGLENIMRTQSEGQNGVIISAHPEDSRPHWAPTGKQFVFDSTLMGDRRHRIYLSNDIDETENEVAEELKPIMYDFWEILGRHPIFLSDGQIAYQGCNVWLNGGSCGIYRINGAGSEPQQITDSPNDTPTDNLGTEILFMSDREKVDNVDNWDVFRVRTDGSGLVRLTEHPAHDGLATASPDGSHVAFVSDRGGTWAVYVMDINGDNQRKLFELNGQFGPGPQYWQYDWKQERLSWGN